MSFAAEMLGPIVRANGRVAAHIPYCSYIDRRTKNRTPRPECDCRDPAMNPFMGGKRRPTTIEIGGTPFTSVIALVMHYNNEWLPPTRISYFQCLQILYEGKLINQINRSDLYNLMRDFAMMSLGTGKLPEITDEDSRQLTEYFLSCFSRP